MAIELLRIESEQELEVDFKIPREQGDPREGKMLICTGIAVCEFKGKGGNWHRDILRFEVGPEFKYTSNWIFAGNAYLNSIRNDGHAVNAGWAVDGVQVVRKLINVDPSTYRIGVNIALAVRDSDGFILRVGYEVNGKWSK